VSIFCHPWLKLFVLDYSLTLALLAAIFVCSLAPSPNMREMAWIPGWIGEWADRNPNFRNFPVFAALSAVLFLVFNTSHAVAASREGGFVFGSLSLNTANCKLKTALRAAVCASALGALLEVAQLLFLSNRHFDWADIGWMSSGALVGAALAAACFRSLSA
jgi:hypothetical protein